MPLPRIEQIMENEIAGIIARCQFDRPADVVPYAINDVVSSSTLSGVNMTFSIGTASVLLMGATFVNSEASVPAGQSGFKLHLYNAAPTAIVDNAAFNLIAADRAKYIGYMQFDLPLDVGDSNISQNNNANIVAKSANGILYGVLTTDTAYTASSTTSTVNITVRGCQC